MLGSEKLILGDDNGQTFKLDPAVYTDNGNAIAFRCKTKYYSFSDGSAKNSSNPGTEKLLQRVQVFGDFPNGLLTSYSRKEVDDTTDYEVLDQVNNENQLLDIYDKGEAFSLGFDDYSPYAVELNGFKFSFKNLTEVL